MKQLFIQLKNWLLSLFRKPTSTKSQTFELHTPMPKDEPDKQRCTKAYADQRQKSQRNRRRKPSKAMRNLYQLR
jgi:hypothetical protein